MMQITDKKKSAEVQASPESIPSETNSHEENLMSTRRQLNYSDSLNNLIKSNALTETIDLCEVFVIIGANEKSIKKALQVSTKDGWVDCDESSYNNSPQKQEMKCQPQILDTYPSIFNETSQFAKQAQNQNIASQIKEQYLYLSNIQLICFPDGYSIDTEFKQQKLNDLCGIMSSMNGNSAGNFNRPSINGQLYKIMHFTITQSCGSKKYLTSLSYKELVLIRLSTTEKKLCFIPKCLIVVSKLPIFSIQKQMLELIYEDVIRKFHSQFNAEFSATDDYVEVEKKIQRAKIQCKGDKLEFYLSTFFHHLQMDGSNLEIEIYKKQVSNADPQQKLSLIKYVNSFNKECLRLENYEFKLLFQKVRPKMLLQMFVSLLHERKIILIHNDSSKNAILIEALISLLYPLQWNFTNISYMIPSMTEYLEAPFPYIVGLPRDLWKTIYEQKWDILGDEVVAFDIDNQKIYSKEELPEFPQPYTQLLIKQLEIQLDKSKQIFNNFHSVDDVQIEQEKFWNNFTLKVKQQFLNFLIFLINTFENFYVTTSKNLDPSFSPIKALLNQGTAASTIDSNGGGVPENKPIINNFNSGGSANDIFNFDDYVQNVRENQGFFEKFVTTQAFINFIEQAFYEEQGNLSDASIRFFKECTRKLAKENIQSVRIMQDEIIQNLMHRFNNRRISYSIDKCYIMYENTLKQKMALIDNDSSFQGVKKKNLGLIQKIEQHKVIKMKALDLKPLIQKQYAKFNEVQLKRVESNAHFQMKALNNTIELNRQSLNINDYFSAQLTPIGKMFETKKEEAEHQFNDTALIKIEDDTQNQNDISIAQSMNKEEDHDQQMQQHDEEAAGFMGFFKKTFSSVKKTFQSTFNNKEMKEEQQLQQQRQIQSPFEDSPDLTKAKQRQNNRASRSQTFHVSSYQPQHRDRKNNESFFTNLINMAIVKKPDNTSIDREVKSALLRSQVDPQTRRNLNGSGFFVFNEEDMKNMTEMSPKNMTGNFRSSNFKFDYQAFDAQLTQRQKPILKGGPMLDNQSFSNRIRSISYQNHNSANFETIKKLKLVDFMEDSRNHGGVDEQAKESVQNRLTFAQKDLTKSPLLSPSFFKKNSLVSNTNDTPVEYSANNSACNTFRKDGLLNKQEFEEIYKKSTENLFYAPPDKSIASTNNTKYNIWKAKTGKLDLKAAKPPKYNNNAALKRSQNKNASLAVNTINKNTTILSPLGNKQIALNSTKVIEIIQQQNMKPQMEETKVAVITCSDNNITDDDHKGPNMVNTKHVSDFRKIMSNIAAEKLSNLQVNKTNSSSGTQLSNQSSQQQRNHQKHRRQISTSSQQQAKPDNGLMNGLGGVMHENIDPEDDSRQSQTSNKQIESMQIGRARKKSNFNTTGISQQFTAINKSISKMGQRKISNARPIQSKINSKSEISKLNFRALNATKGNTDLNLQRNLMQARNNKSSNVRDEDTEMSVSLSSKLQNRHLQPKTVQSQHSSRSYQSSDHDSMNIAPNNNNLQCSTVGLDRKKELSKYIMKKQHQLSSEVNLMSQQSKIASSSVVVYNMHKSLRSSTDLRDHNNETAGLISFPANQYNQPLSPIIAPPAITVGLRMHSYSQYADQNRHPNKINVQMVDEFDDDTSEGHDHEHSKLSQFRSHLKPLNKITYESFNQIAKLSGDVDHEPNTPQSGANITDEEEDDDDI